MSNLPLFRDNNLIANSFQSFAGCTSGVQAIGFVTATYNISAAMAAYISGVMVKYTGRAPILVAGWILHTIISVIMVLWKPETASGWEVYVMTSMWGVGYGYRETQTTGMLH